MTDEEQRKSKLYYEAVETGQRVKSVKELRKVAEDFWKLGEYYNAQELYKQYLSKAKKRRIKNACIISVFSLLIVVFVISIGRINRYNSIGDWYHYGVKLRLEGLDYYGASQHDGITEARNKKDMRGLVDLKTGELIVPCIYEQIGYFNDGLAWVKRNGKSGFIDITGKEVIPCIYDDVNSFDEGLGLVQKNGKWGFIDISGSEQIPFTYDTARRFYGGLAAVGVGNSLANMKYGFINKNGELVIPIIYDRLIGSFCFIEGIAEVEIDGRRIAIDRTGQELYEIDKKPSSEPIILSGRFDWVEEPDIQADYSLAPYYISRSVEGRIKNITGTTLSSVAIEFILYDSGGNQIGTAIDYIGNLLAGNTWKFSAFIFYSDAVSFEFSRIVAT